MSKTMRVLWAAVMAAASVRRAAAAQTIVVGGKAFTEQQIMTAMTVQLLKAKGFTPERKAGMGSAAVRVRRWKTARSTCTGNTRAPRSSVFNKITDKFRPAEEAYKKIKEVDGAKDIVWLNMSPANNTYAFAMNKDDAKKLGIVTMSDLAKAVKDGAKLTFASQRRVLRASRRIARLADRRMASSSSATT